MSFIRRLRKRVEKPYQARFWGQICTINAKLLPGRFGDGKLLIAIQPLNTRPQYYVARVDSCFRPSRGCDTLNSDEWYDFLDEELKPAIEEHFGSRPEEEYEEPLEVYAWPVADFSLGCSWFVYAMPGPVARPREAKPQ